MNQSERKTASSKLFDSRFWITMSFVLLMGLIWILCKPLQHDEAEFFQTSWLMAQNKIIFKDFFQHHHPLAYYFYIPVLKFMQPEMTWTNLIILRLPGLVILMLNMAMVYRLAAVCFNSATAVISLLLLATWPMFMLSLLFARPDMLMFLCILAGMCMIFDNPGGSSGIFRWTICGALCGLAFAFLQKAIVFDFLIFLVLLARVFRKRESWKCLVGFAAGGIIATAVFLAIFIFPCGYEIYKTCCWDFNAQSLSFLNRTMITRWIIMMMYACIPLWGALGLCWAIKRRQAVELAFLGIVGGYGTFEVSPYTHPQYATFMMITASIFGSFLIYRLAARFGKKAVVIISCFFILTTPQYLARLLPAILEGNRSYMALYAKINQVNPDERFIMTRHFYVFSQQPGYVWFNWEYILPNWNALAKPAGCPQAKSYTEMFRQTNPLLVVDDIEDIDPAELRQKQYKPVTSLTSSDKNIWSRMD